MSDERPIRTDSLPPNVSWAMVGYRLAKDLPHVVTHLACVGLAAFIFLRTGGTDATQAVLLALLPPAARMWWLSRPEIDR